MANKDKEIRRLENKIKYWTEYCQELRDHADRILEFKIATATTDAQRNKWCKYNTDEHTKASRLYAENVEPANDRLRQLMFADDEPNDGLDA